MNARTLAAIVVRISALVMLADVLADFAPTALSLFAPFASAAAAASVRTELAAMAIGLVARLVIAVVLLAGADVAARWVVPEHLSAASIGVARLSALSLSLVALLLLAEGIERVTGPLYVLLVSGGASARINPSTRLFAAQRGGLARAVVMIAAAVVILWRVRIADRLRAASAAVRRPPLDR